MFIIGIVFFGYILVVVFNKNSMPINCKEEFFMLHIAFYFELELWC